MKCAGSGAIPNPAQPNNAGFVTTLYHSEGADLPSHHQKVRTDTTTEHCLPRQPAFSQSLSWSELHPLPLIQRSFMSKKQYLISETSWNRPSCDVLKLLLWSMNLLIGSKHIRRLLMCRSSVFKERSWDFIRVGWCCPVNGNGATKK